jgi:hypothetical protein
MIEIIKPVRIVEIFLIEVGLLAMLLYGLQHLADTAKWLKKPHRSNITHFGTLSMNIYTEKI